VPTPPLRPTDQPRPQRHAALPAGLSQRPRHRHPAARLRVPRARGHPPSLPRRQLARLHGRRRAADPRPGQAVLVGRREVGAIKSTEACTLDPLLQRAFSVAKRVRTETQIGSSDRLHRLGRRRTRAQDLRLARRQDGPARRRRQDVRPHRAPPHPAGRTTCSSPTAPRPARGHRRLAAHPRHHHRRHSVRATARAVAPRRHHHHQHRRRPCLHAGAGTRAAAAPPQPPGLLHRHRRAARRGPEVNELEGCFVYDIDDLQQVAAQNQAVAQPRGRGRRVHRHQGGRPLHRPSRAGPGTPSPSSSSCTTPRPSGCTRSPASPAALSGISRSASEQLAAIDRLTKSLTAKLLHPQIAALLPRAAAADTPTTAPRRFRCTSRSSSALHASAGYTPAESSTPVQRADASARSRSRPSPAPTWCAYAHPCPVPIHTGSSSLPAATSTSATPNVRS
jgi:hypothetical protein